MIRTSVWERLERVIRWTGLSGRAFAVQIGLRSPQTLYQIKAGKHSISRSLAERICGRYPEVSISWLLGGRGDMFLEGGGYGATKGCAKVPYYEEPCERVVVSPERYSPSGYTFTPGCGDCSLAAPTEVADMEPVVSPGAVLYCRECGVDELTSGDLVVMLWAGRVFVRLVGRISPSHIELTTPANNPLTNLSAERTLIGRLWRVKGVLKLR